MVAFANLLTQRFGRFPLASSSLTVGTATSVVLCAALFGVVVDRVPDSGARPALTQPDLALRGTIAPSDQPLARPPEEIRPSERAIVARL